MCFNFSDIWSTDILSFSVFSSIWCSSDGRWSTGIRQRKECVCTLCLLELACEQEHVLRKYQQLSLWWSFSIKFVDSSNQLHVLTWSFKMHTCISMTYMYVDVVIFTPCYCILFTMLYGNFLAQQIIRDINNFEMNRHFNFSVHLKWGFSHLGISHLKFKGLKTHTLWTTL